ncbi:MAG: single-stranded-DNA-specific exonuclease RecJ [Clostridiales bacterium]|nr:single-stranded-DNA-specific exonuclease RecJ [Clostridiales bacterium]
MSIWMLRSTDADLPLMSKTLGISETAALIMANRGVRSKKTCQRFMHPDLRLLGDAHAMKDMAKACEMLEQSLSDKEKIAVFGDFDVDGVMSTVILIKLLRECGADAEFLIPMRSENGYGLSDDMIKAIVSMGAKLLICCDNGIAAREEILEAKRLGIKTIVIDHHEPNFIEDENGARTDLIPEADCVIDPKQQSCGYPFKQFCAAGLSFRFAEAFCSLIGRNFLAREECLVFAAVATVCDIVPLLEENRILVKSGLDVLNRCKQINAGLWHLMLEKKISDKKLSVFDIGFLLGPCINASGRLSSAQNAVKLFLTEDTRKAAELARALSELNETRKEMTELAVDKAMDRIFSDEASEIDKVVVIYDESINESIAGIVAGRIKEALSRPVVVLTKGEKHVKGSARSIEGYSIFDALNKNRDLFVRFGGHAMAAGVTLEEKSVEPLRIRLNADCPLCEDDFKTTLYIDKLFELPEATLELAEEIASLAPFGKGNPEPMFQAKALRPESIRMIEDKNMMILTFPVASCRKIRAVCFRKNDVFRVQIEELFSQAECENIFAGNFMNAPFKMDIVCTIEVNSYRNIVSAQLGIKDFRIRKG